MSAAALDREKLARVLGMLGSAHDGEIAAAGRAADAIVRAAGLTWQEVLAPDGLRKVVPVRGITVNDLIETCLESEQALTGWESGFVWSLKPQRYPLSQKQLATLTEIFEKVRRTSARAA